jgi:uncharacterized protein (DUF2141 family)
MNTNYYAKTKRQYKYLIKRLNKVLHTKEWESYSEEKQNKLKARLNSLLKKLDGAFSRPSLIKAMGTAALVLGLSVSSMAQSFKAPVTNPFSLINKGTLGVPTFVDIDGDGDLDLFDIGIDPTSYSISVQFIENTGSKTAATFGAKADNPFGIVSDSITLKAAFADLDNDGDYDMLRTTYGYGTQLYYKNSGTKTAPAFDAPIANPFGLTGLAYANAPVFADLDNDGDQDLFVGEYYGGFQYFENTGTKASPQFAAPTLNPFGLTNNGNGGYINVPVLSDVDGDGDLDIMMTEYYGDFLYYENTGTKAAPQFAASTSNPFSLSNVGSYSFMSFADLDGDSDDDIFTLEYYGDYKFFENNSGIGLNENALNNQLSVFPNPANGVVNISLGEDLGAASIEVTSMSGQLVLSEAIKSTNNASVDVSKLETGVYILKLTADNRVGIKKLVIE